MKSTQSQTMKYGLLALMLCLLASPAFAQSTQCNTAPPTSGTVVTGQSFTIGWCNGPNDTNGNPTTITGHKIYRNGVVVTGPAVITDSPNAAGQRYSHAMSSESVTGTFTYTVASSNNSGDSAQASPVFTLTVILPPSVPTAPTGIRVTAP